MSSNNIHKINKCFANRLLIPEIIKMLEEGHSVTLPLRGYSMRPFLEDGRDMALLTSPVDIKVGDPVLADIKASVIGFYRKGRRGLDRTDGRKWRTYSRIWLFLSPVRRYLLGFYRRIWIKFFGPI